MDLSFVFDLRAPDEFGFLSNDLYDDRDYAVAQRLAAEAHHRGAEGLLVWSAAVDPPGGAINLIIYPDNLRSGSSIRATGRWTSIRWFDVALGE